MAIRTNATDVADILEDYNSDISLTPFIRTASLIVDRVSAQDDENALSDDVLQDMEMWLAAHCYALRDQLASQDRAGKSSIVYQGKTAMRLDFTQYGQMAQTLDFTGTLASLGQAKGQARINWLGTEAS